MNNMKIIRVLGVHLEDVAMDLVADIYEYLQNNNFKIVYRTEDNNYESYNHIQYLESAVTVFVIEEGRVVEKKLVFDRWVFFTFKYERISNEASNSSKKLYYYSDGNPTYSELVNQLNIIALSQEVGLQNHQVKISEIEKIPQEMYVEVTKTDPTI